MTDIDTQAEVLPSRDQAMTQIRKIGARRAKNQDKARRDDVDMKRAVKVGFKVKIPAVEMAPHVGVGPARLYQMRDEPDEVDGGE
jgi:hypothetical protein